MQRSRPPQQAPGRLSRVAAGEVRGQEGKGGTQTRMISRNAQRRRPLTPSRIDSQRHEVHWMTATRRGSQSLSYPRRVRWRAANGCSDRGRASRVRTPRDRSRTASRARTPRDRSTYRPAPRCQGTADPRHLWSGSVTVGWAGSARCNQQLPAGRLAGKKGRLSNTRTGGAGWGTAG